MNELIIHPTKAYKKPITPRKRRTATGWRDLTVAELRQACASRGVKFTTKHTKPELIAMAQTGIYIRPAAYAKAAKTRKAKID